ncbi:hypothetical protein [Mycobacterium marinum]|uniref:hypothetical protein n=1 Tax=Mycobacterium marinum TaxID=1781 RepID=UPI003563D06F
MSKKRLDTILAIASSRAALSNSTKLNLIIGEFNSIATADSVSKEYRWLLKILYTTRALDTCLSEIIAHKNWHGQSEKYSLGSYLKVLANNGALNENLRVYYQKNVVEDKRNKYMHETGATPDRLIADRVLSEMLACLSTILAGI